MWISEKLPHQRTVVVHYVDIGLFKVVLSGSRRGARRFGFTIGHQTKIFLTTDFSWQKPSLKGVSPRLSNNIDQLNLVYWTEIYSAHPTLLTQAPPHSPLKPTPHSSPTYTPHSPRSSPYLPITQLSPLWTATIQKEFKCAFFSSFSPLPGRHFWLVCEWFQSRFFCFL